MDGSNFPPPRLPGRAAGGFRLVMRQAMALTVLFFAVLALGCVLVARVPPVADPLWPLSWADGALSGVFDTWPAVRPDERRSQAGLATSASAGHG